MPLSGIQAHSASLAAAFQSSVTEQEIARVEAIKEQRAKQLLRDNPAIFGVGVSASDDTDIRTG